MKRGMVLLAILVAGCGDASEETPAKTGRLPQATVADEGSEADGELIVLHLPGMV